MFNASDLLGGLLQGGGPRGHATGRLEHAMGQGGGGAGYQGGAGGGGILGSLAGMLGGRSRGGMGGALGAGMGGGGMGGGLGSVLGGLGGGSSRGAVGAGGLAMLGMLAMNALRNRQQPTASTPTSGTGAAFGGGTTPDPDAMAPEQTTSEHAAGLVLRAMIDAAKADGRVDATERQRIVAKAQEGEEDPEAAAFLERELERPADPDGLAAEARDPVVAAQVYAASLLAIQLDTEEERQYLRSLAGKLGLEPSVVAQLHSALGAPLAA